MNEAPYPNPNLINTNPNLKPLSEREIVIVTIDFDHCIIDHWIIE